MHKVKGNAQKKGAAQKALSTLVLVGLLCAGTSQVGAINLYGSSTAPYGPTITADPNNEAIAIANKKAEAGFRAVAIGGTVRAKAGSVAIGDNVFDDGANNSVLIGNQATTSQSYSVVIGQQAHNYSYNGVAIGSGATTTKVGNNAYAMGNNAIADGLNATAVGRKVETHGTFSASLGSDNVLYGNTETPSENIGQTDTDTDNGNKGAYNNVLGAKNTVGTKDNLVNNVGVLGSKNNITGSKTFVIGNNITSSASNAVILGDQSSGTSYTTTVDGVARTISNAAVKALTFGSFAGSAVGVVSVGSRDNERQIINVAPGAISATSTDAINGSQLFSVANNVNNLGTSITNIIGGGATLGSDGSITYPTTDTDGIGGTGKTNIDDAIASINTATKNAKTTVVAGTSGNVTVTPTAPNTDAPTEYTVDVAKDLNVDSVTTGNTKVSSDGITINNGGTSVSLTANGLDNGKNKITNVADGEVSSTSQDAINGGQLYNSNKNIADIIGGNTAVGADGTITTSDIGGTLTNTIDEAIRAVQTAATNAKTTVVAGSANITVTPTTPNTDSPTEYTVDVAKKLNLESVTVRKQNDDGTTSTVSLTGSGLDNGGNKITNVANGDVSSTSQDAVNGSQLYTVQEKANSPLSFAGDSGSAVERQLGSTINITGGVTDATKLTSGNIGVVADNSTNSLNIALAKNITGLESVTTKDAAGNQTVVNGGGISITTPGGNNVSLTTEGLNNGGNTITNIGAGVNDTDAVNVGQLNTVKNDVHQLSGEIDRVGALSAALGGLTPLQYDPLEPTQIMVAYGNYRSSQAIALGVARYLNDSTLIHGGIAYGGSSSYQSNIGVTWKIGSSDAERAVPARYRNGVAASTYILIDEVQALKVDNAKMHAENEKLQQQIQLLLSRVK